MNRRMIGLTLMSLMFFALFQTVAAAIPQPTVLTGTLRLTGTTFTVLSRERGGSIRETILGFATLELVAWARTRLNMAVLVYGYWLAYPIMFVVTSHM